MAGCVALTPRQVGYWKDSETLFRHAVQVTRNNYLAYNNLGFYLSNKGDHAGPRSTYQSSLAINPDYEDALNNLGYALAQEGRYQEAVTQYERALRINPKLTEAHNNLGNALAGLGRRRGRHPRVSDRLGGKSPSCRRP